MSNRFTTEIKRVNEGLTVIILAAGMGRRMKQYGPKSLLKYQGKTILEWQIETINSIYKNTDIILCSGFKANRLEKVTPDYVRLVENSNYESTNTIESLRLALNVSKPSNLLVLHGDLLFNSAAISFPSMKESIICIEKSGGIDSDEIGCVIQDNHITNLDFGLKDIWGQINFIHRSGYDDLKYICRSCKKNLSLYEVMNRMINKGHSFKAHQNKDMKILEIDNAKDLSEISE